MKIDSNQLWKNFKDCLLSTLAEFPIIKIEEAWVSQKERTFFYFEHLLPKIAEKMNLGFRKEKPFRIDGIFFKQGGQTTEVPLIYLESENNPASTHEEIFKLCCLNAPLKILFICADWTDKTKESLSKGNWQYIIDDFNDEVSLTGHIAIIVAEWNERLKFYSYVFDENAKIIEDKLLLEI